MEEKEVASELRRAKELIERKEFKLVAVRSFLATYDGKVESIKQQMRNLENTFFEYDGCEDSLTGEVKRLRERRDNLQKMLTTMRELRRLKSKQSELALARLEKAKKTK